MDMSTGVWSEMTFCDSYPRRFQRETTGEVELRPTFQAEPQMANSSLTRPKLVDSSLKLV